MPLRLALLGTWHLHAAHHLEEAQTNPNTEVLVVWDDRPSTAQTFAEEHGLPWETDLDAVLGRPDIDGVIVDTETTRHREIIERALIADKHVFSEKVLTTTSADADVLVETALKRGRALTVSFPRLSEPAVRTAARLIQEGRLGTITASRIRHAHHGAVGVPWIPEHFLAVAGTGGGALIDLGAHPLYLSMLFHGATPDRITAAIGYQSGREVEDNASALLEYAGGVLSVIEMSMVASFFAYSFEVTGTGGSVVLGPAGDTLRLRTGQDSGWEDVQLDTEGPSPFDQFVQHARGGGPDLGHVRLARDVTRLIEAGYESARQGRTVARE